MLARALILLLALLPLAAHSSEHCPNLYNRRFKSNVYYVLAYLGNERAPSDPQQRSAKLGELEGRTSRKLQDYVYKLTDQLPDAPPIIIFLTCDSSIGADDLTLQGIETPARRNVIAALWTSNEGSASAITQLSLPYFQRKPLAQRRQIEIAWKMLASGEAASVDDWISELDRESVAQQTLLAMNVGFMALNAAQLPLAKRSFCQVQVNLKLMGSEILRPGIAELQKGISTLMLELIAEVDALALRKGLDLNSSAPVRLTCGQ